MPHRAAGLPMLQSPTVRFSSAFIRMMPPKIGLLYFSLSQFLFDPGQAGNCLAFPLPRRLIFFHCGACFINPCRCLFSTPPLFFELPQLASKEEQHERRYSGSCRQGCCHRVKPSCLCKERMFYLPPSLKCFAAVGYIVGQSQTAMVGNTQQGSQLSEIWKPYSKFMPRTLPQ